MPDLNDVNVMVSWQKKEMFRRSFRFTTLIMNWGSPTTSDTQVKTVFIHTQMSYIWTNNFSSENNDISHFYIITVTRDMVYGTTVTSSNKKQNFLHMHPVDCLNFMTDYTLKYRTGGSTQTPKPTTE
jgi:hypothetical protein